MQLIVISDDSFFDGETALVNALFKAGMAQFHLRKPSASIEEIIDYIEEIDERFRKHISLHQWHELAEVYNIGGIHYPEEKRKATTNNTRSLLKTKGFRLSTSVHTLQDAMNLSNQFDYCFLSPVFNSISKPGYQSAFDSRLCVNSNTVKIIALGGITNNNTGQVKDMGFDGVAVMGYMWQEPEKAIEHFGKIKQICDTH